MQLQEKILELFSKKVSDIKSAFSGKPNKIKSTNLRISLLDTVISEQLSSWGDRIAKGIEKNKKLSVEFINWVIIEYNLKCEEKIDPENLNVINEVFKRLKERGVMLDEEDINKQIIQKNKINDY